jgi:hypothetical protein
LLGRHGHDLNLIPDRAIRQDNGICTQLSLDLNERFARRITHELSHVHHG